MTFQKIQFEKHDGFMDFSSGCVEFYKLVFTSIFHVRKFLGSVKPGNYTGWVNGTQFGLVDLDSGWIYMDRAWFPPNSLDIGI